MKRSRFSEEQSLAMLKEQEVGMTTADVCRRHGGEFRDRQKTQGETWRARGRAMCAIGSSTMASHVRRLRALEKENDRLKWLLPEAMLDNPILKNATAKNGRARCEAGGGGACRNDPRSEPAPGAQGPGGEQVERALAQRPPRRG
jgi:putative transposase